MNFVRFRLDLLQALSVCMRDPAYTFINMISSQWGLTQCRRQ